MINKPPPFKGRNIRIPIIMPTKGRGFINHGSGLSKQDPRFHFCAARLVEPWNREAMASGEALRLDASYGQGLGVCGVGFLGLMSNNDPLCSPSLGGVSA